MEILIYRRQRVDCGEQDDITGLVPPVYMLRHGAFEYLSTKELKEMIKNCVPGRGLQTVNHDINETFAYFWDCKYYDFPESYQGDIYRI